MGHDLINNCSRCGKIVCTQEGAGPCLYCGEFVASKNQLEYFASGTKRAKEDEARYKSGKILDNPPSEWTEYYGMNFFMKNSGTRFDKNSKNSVDSENDLETVMSTAINKMSILPEEESLKKAETHKNK